MTMALEKPTVDATKPLKIHIRREDAKRGVPGDFYNCTFAQVERRLPGALAAYVTRTLSLIEYEDRIVRYQHPRPVRDAVALIDIAKGTTGYGHYWLMPPTPSNRREAKAARDKLRPNRSSANPSFRRDKQTLAGVRNGSGHVFVPFVEPPMSLTPEDTSFPYAPEYTTGQTKSPA